jgi:hypothetical protein
MEQLFELCTDFCRGTVELSSVPMEPPMSNCSMHHRELLKWNLPGMISDTRDFLQGASYTIAATAAVYGRTYSRRKAYGRTVFDVYSIITE